MASDRLTKISENLKKSIQDGDYYEAHQRTRTLASRYLMKKQYSEAYKILTEIAESLSEKGEMKSSSDLAILYTEVLEKSGDKVDDDRIDDVGGLLFFGVGVKKIKNFLFFLQKS